MTCAVVYTGIRDRHPSDEDPLGDLSKNLDILRGALRALVNRQSGVVVTLV